LLLFFIAEECVSHYAIRLDIDKIYFYKGGDLMFGLGLPEMAIILAIAVLLFGSSKLPQLGKGLGEAISGFRKALTEDKKDKIQPS